MPLTECPYCRKTPGAVVLGNRAFPCPDCNGTAQRCNLCGKNPCDEDCGKSALPEKGAEHGP